MAYLGNDLQVAFPVYRNIDDISGSFNSSTTSFPLRVSGVAPVPAPLYSQQCLISVGGVVQRPDDSGSEGFRLSGGNIIFASAPTTGADFFGIILAGADYINAGGNFPSGTAAVPSITFNDDLDTGIYNSGINQVSITTGGSERLRIDSAGQIESVSLGTAAAPAFSFITDPNTGIYSPGADQVAISTGGSGRLFVDASGNVGVAAAPSAFGTRTAIQLNGSTSNWFAGGANGTTVFSRNIYNDGSNKFIGTGFASIYYQSTAGDHVWERSSASGTAGAAATMLEALRITSAGLVGVGTSSPGFKLTIEDSTTPRIRIGDGVRHLNVDGGSASQNAAIGTDYAGSFGIYTNGAANTRFHITSAGLVGIGTTSPGQALSVAGNISSSAVGTNYVASSSQGVTTSYLITDTSGGNIQVDGAWPIRFTTNSNERARIDSSGRLLVGTSSARSTATLGTNYQALIEKAGDYAGFSVFGNKANNQGSYFVMGKSRGTTAGAVNAVAADDVLGYIGFEGTDGTSSIRAADIFVAVDGTPGANDMPGRLVFSTTADGASSPTERMRITNDGQTYFGITGNTGLGTTNRGFLIRNELAGKTYVQLASTGTTTDTVFYFYNGNGLVGSISMNGSATAYNTSSDYRLKENVAPVPDGITRLQQLKPSRFNFIADPATTVDGFIAHEVQAVVPEAITGEKDAVDDQGNPQYQGIDQSKLVPLLTAALQEAIGEIESLKARVAALESA